MPRIPIRTKIMISPNWRFADEMASMNMSYRILNGRIPVPKAPATPGAPAAVPEVVPTSRSLEVDGVTQTIEADMEYWGARESQEGKWQRLSQNDVFVYPFEIGNFESVKMAKAGYEETQRLDFNDKIWMHVCVGVVSVGLDATKSAGMKEWALEHKMEYFEVTVDDGPSIDEMLTEIVRNHRHMPPNDAEARDVLFAKWMAKLRAANPEYYRRMDEYARKYNKKNGKSNKALEDSRKWQKTEKGWVADGTAVTAGGSRGCAIM